jgi:L-alanine-DL-glutamate epimerase-like enolase superfamily enzyme
LDSRRVRAQSTWRRVDILKDSIMKITDAKVIVCSPGRNFVTLKIYTDQGVYGLGDATLNGMEKSVVSYLEDYWT